MKTQTSGDEGEANKSNEALNGAAVVTVRFNRKSGVITAGTNSDSHVMFA